MKALGRRNALTSPSLRDGTLPLPQAGEDKGHCLENYWVSKVCDDEIRRHISDDGQKLVQCFSLDMQSWNVR